MTGLPSVTFVPPTPDSGTQIDEGVYMSVAVDVSSVLLVDRVEFLIDGEVVAEKDTPPYEFLHRAPEVQESTALEIGARAYDSRDIPGPIAGRIFQIIPK